MYSYLENVDLDTIVRVSSQCCAPKKNRIGTLAEEFEALFPMRFAQDGLGSSVSPIWHQDPLGFHSW